MGLFSSKGESHGDECRDRHGTWWAKPNPMGWGSNDARTVKRTGSPALSQSTRPTEHGSRMNIVGGLLRWDATRERPTGEGPGRGRLCGSSCA